MCFVQSGQECVFFFTASLSVLPLLIGRCRFCFTKLHLPSLCSSCDLFCLYSTILTPSLSQSHSLPLFLTIKEIPADPIWYQVFVKEGATDTCLKNLHMIPCLSVAQLACSSGSHPPNWHHACPCWGASRASCPLFVGGSVCLE